MDTLSSPFDHEVPQMPNSTVLIVDDEKNILLTLNQALQLEGYKVELAAGGQLEIGRAHV